MNSTSKIKIILSCVKYLKQTRAISFYFSVIVSCDLIYFPQVTGLSFCHLEDGFQCVSTASTQICYALCEFIEFSGDKNIASLGNYRGFNLRLCNSDQISLLDPCVDGALVRKPLIKLGMFH